MRYPELDMLFIIGSILYLAACLVMAWISGEFKKSDSIDGAEEFFKSLEENENECSKNQT